MLESGGGGGGSGGGRRVDGEGGGGGGERRGHMGCEEHVVGLYGGADEEAGEGDDGEAEPAGEVLICESLGGMLAENTTVGMYGESLWGTLHSSSNLWQARPEIGRRLLVLCC